MSALLIAIGSVGLFGISQSNDALKSVYEDRTVAAGQMADIQSALLENRLAIAASLITPTPEMIATQSRLAQASAAPGAAAARNGRRPAVTVNPPKRVTNTPAAAADESWEEF